MLNKLIEKAKKDLVIDTFDLVKECEKFPSQYFEYASYYVAKAKAKEHAKSGLELEKSRLFFKASQEYESLFGLSKKPSNDFIQNWVTDQESVKEKSATLADLSSDCASFHEIKEAFFQKGRSLETLVKLTLSPLYPTINTTEKE